MPTKTKQRTPEEQEALDARMAKMREKRAEKAAAKIEADAIAKAKAEAPPTIEDTTDTKAGIDLGLSGNPSAAVALRSMKIVKAECQVPRAIMGKIEYTTGPCQVDAQKQPGGVLNWFKTCTHGPEVDGNGEPIPKALRPYYEGQVQVEQKPVIGAGGVIEGEETVRRWVVRLRLSETVADPVAMSGVGPQYWAQRGAKDVAEFGLAPFCSFYRCWRQAGVRQFKNGMFCSALHAKLIKARETGMILAMGGFDSAWPRAVSSEKRTEQLRSIDV